MTKVLVVYASRHGGTRGIAGRIGEVLRAEGIQAEVTAADQVTDVANVDAFVVGSGVYMGSWLQEAVGFIKHYESALAARPVWLFSSGPLLGSSASKGAEDALANALGPEDGPGSGGRKRIEELRAATHALDHRVFFGAFDPTDRPRAMSERLVRLIPAFKRVLPAGDFRNWDEIETWGREIAATLAAKTAPAIA